MALTVDVDDVTSVCVDGEWHRVANASFSTDALDLVWYGDLHRKESHDPVVREDIGVGFSFDLPDGRRMFGKLSSISAYIIGEEHF